MKRLDRAQQSPAQAAPDSDAFSSVLLKKKSGVSTLREPQLTQEQKQSALKEKWDSLLCCPEVKIPFLETAKVAAEKMKVFKLPDGEYYLGEPDGHMRRVKDFSDDVQAQVQSILQLMQPASL